MGFSAVIKPLQITEVPVRCDHVYIQYCIHVLGDNNLLVPKPLTENFNGLLIVG